MPTYFYYLLFNATVKLFNYSKCNHCDIRHSLISLENYYPYYCFLRPWYVKGATSSYRDIVIVIDMSEAMRSNKELVIESTHSILGSLSPNDRVSSPTYCIPKLLCVHPPSLAHSPLLYTIHHCTLIITTISTDCFENT